MTWILLGFLAVAAVASPQDSTGTIQGRVLEVTSDPFAFANVVVAGTRRGAMADESGRYRLTLVPLGPRTIRVFGIGHRPVEDTIFVRPGINEVRPIRLGKLVEEPGMVLEHSPRPAVSPGDLIVEMVPDRTPVKVFEPVAFHVQIRNRSAHPILLMRCTRARHGPSYDLRVAAPFGAFRSLQTGPRLICTVGTRQSMDEAAFVELQPGEAFDPTSGEGISPNPPDGVPTRPGHYTAVYRYSTLSPAFLSWIAELEDPEVRQLAERVPAVELEGKADFKVNY
jgi:hypothetical protein